MAVGPGQAKLAVHPKAQKQKTGKFVSLVSRLGILRKIQHENSPNKQSATTRAGAPPGAGTTLFALHD
jgi:hypothetical protein